MVSLRDKSLDQILNAIDTLSFSELSQEMILNDMWGGGSIDNRKIEVKNLYRNRNSREWVGTYTLAQKLGISVDLNIVETYDAYDISKIRKNDALNLNAKIGGKLSREDDKNKASLLLRLAEIGKLKDIDAQLVRMPKYKEYMKKSSSSIFRMFDNIAKRPVWNPSNNLLKYLAATLYDIKNYSPIHSIDEYNTKSINDMKMVTGLNSNDKITLIEKIMEINVGLYNPTDLAIIKLPQYKLLYNITDNTSEIYTYVRYGFDKIENSISNLRYDRAEDPTNINNYYMDLTNKELANNMFDRQLYFSNGKEYWHRDLYLYDQSNPQYIDAIKAARYDLGDNVLNKLFTKLHGFDINIFPIDSSEIFRTYIQVFGHCRKLRPGKNAGATTSYSGGPIASPEQAYSIANEGKLINVSKLIYDKSLLSHSELVGMAQHKNYMTYENYKLLREQDDDNLDKFLQVSYISGKTSKLMTREEKIFTLSRCYYPTDFDYTSRSFFTQLINNILPHLNAWNKLILSSSRSITDEEDRHITSSTIFKLISQTSTEYINDFIKILKIFDKEETGALETLGQIKTKYEITRLYSGQNRRSINNLRQNVSIDILEELLYNIPHFKDQDQPVEILSLTFQNIKDRIGPKPRGIINDNRLLSFANILNKYSYKELQEYTSLSKKYSKADMIKTIIYLLNGPGFYVNTENNVYFGNISVIDNQINNTLIDGSLNTEHLDTILTIGAIDNLTQPGQHYKNSFKAALGNTNGLRISTSIRVRIMNIISDFQ